MRIIELQELSVERFARYGSYRNMTDITDVKAYEGSNVFAPDLLAVDLHDEIASFSVAEVSACERKITAIEYHEHTCEGLLPLDGDCIIFVGAPSWEPSTDYIEAFHIRQGTMVRLNVGVIHGRQFTMDKEQIHVLIVLPVRTYGNDCKFIELTEDKQFMIRYPSES